MSKSQFIVLIGMVIAAAGFTILALMGIFGSPLLPLLALVASLLALILGRKAR